MLEKFFDSKQQQAFINVKADLQFDSMHLIMLEVAAQSTVTLTLTAGAIESSSKALARKNSAAVKTIANKGVVAPKRPIARKR